MSITRRTDYVVMVSMSFTMRLIVPFPAKLFMSDPYELGKIIMKG